VCGHLLPQFPLPDTEECYANDHSHSRTLPGYVRVDKDACVRLSYQLLALNAPWEEFNLLFTLIGCANITLQEQGKGFSILNPLP